MQVENPHSQHEAEVDGEPMAVGTRAEGGSWSTVVSLLALALIGLMLLHACMKPGGTGTAASTVPSSAVSR